MNAKDVQAMIFDALRVLGFRGSAGSYFLDLGKELTGFIGVTCTKRPGGTVSAWIVVGIRYEDIHARGVALGGYPNSIAQPSIAVAMKYLCADDSCGEYQFTGSNQSDEPELKRLVRDVSRLATAFYTQLASVDKALEAISEGLIRGLQNAEVFAPVAMLVQGRTADAIITARKALSKMDSRRGTGKQYAAFVERLVANAQH